MSNRSRSILISIVIHATIVVLLLIFGFSTPLPLPSEEGILINFGTSNDGAGDFEPTQSPITQQQQQTVKPEEKDETPLTQDIEEAPSLPEPKPKENPKPQPEKPKEQKPEETTQQQEQPKVEPEKPREVNQQALFPGKKPDGSTTGEGETGKPGNQGDPAGSTESTSHTGGPTGGSGDGISFSLGTRGAVSLPKPEYPKQKSGKVVVRVTVDRNGNVITAEPGRPGSTTLDSDLLNAAERAAKMAKFDVSPTAPASQSGTITYIFKLQQ